jgi:hypothetical protein
MELFLATLRVLGFQKIGVRSKVKAMQYRHYKNEVSEIVHVDSSYWIFNLDGTFRETVACS